MFSTYFKCKPSSVMAFRSRSLCSKTGVDHTACLVAGQAMRYVLCFSPCHYRNAYMQFKDNECSQSSQASKCWTRDQRTASPRGSAEQVGCHPVVPARATSTGAKLWPPLSRCRSGDLQPEGLRSPGCSRASSPSKRAWQLHLGLHWCTAIIKGRGSRAMQLTSSSTLLAGRSLLGPA